MEFTSSVVFAAGCIGLLVGLVNLARSRKVLSDAREVLAKSEAASKKARELHDDLLNIQADVKALIQQCNAVVESE